MAHSAMKDMWEMRMKETEKREGEKGTERGMRGRGGDEGKTYENDVCVTAVDIDAPSGH